MMNNPFKELFISYGRRESLGFVGHLHQQFKLAGYDAWFDKVNIPDGNDYAQRINHGIESAHNLVYVMAPRCLTSPYCLMELKYTRLLSKRVISINHRVIFNTASRVLPNAVTLTPYDRNARDSRALARALTGNIQGAIENFQFAIEKFDDKKFKKTIPAWVTALEKGENLFTLESLCPTKMVP